MRSHFHTWIGHHRVLTLTPLKVFGMCWKRLKEWFDSPVINTKSRPKIMQLWMEINVVTLHKVCRNNATANALRNQSWKFEGDLSNVVTCDSIVFLSTPATIICIQSKTEHLFSEKKIFSMFLFCNFLWKKKQLEIPKCYHSEETRIVPVVKGCSRIVTIIFWAICYLSLCQEKEWYLGVNVSA